MCIRMKADCSIYRLRDFTAGISSRMRASPSPRCARSVDLQFRLPLMMPACPRPTGPPVCTGWVRAVSSKSAPVGSELWLDGGHNPDGGRAIAAALADLEERVSRPLVLIVGMLATKDSEGFLSNFAGLARRMIAVPFPMPKRG